MIRELPNLDMEESGSIVSEAKSQLASSSTHKLSVHSILSSETAFEGNQKIYHDNPVSLCDCNTVIDGSKENSVFSIVQMGALIDQSINVPVFTYAEKAILDSRLFHSPLRKRFKTLERDGLIIDSHNMLRRIEPVRYCAKIKRDNAIERFQSIYERWDPPMMMYHADSVEITILPEYEDLVPSNTPIQHCIHSVDTLTQIAWRPFGKAGSRQFFNVLVIPKPGFKFTLYHEYESWRCIHQYIKTGFFDFELCRSSFESTESEISQHTMVEYSPCGHWIAASDMYGECVHIFRSPTHIEASSRVIRVIQEYKTKMRVRRRFLQMTWVRSEWSHNLCFVDAAGDSFELSIDGSQLELMCDCNSYECDNYHSLCPFAGVCSFAHQYEMFLSAHRGTASAMLQEDGSQYEPRFDCIDCNMRAMWSQSPIIDWSGRLFLEDLHIGLYTWVEEDDIDILGDDGEYCDNIHPWMIEPIVVSSKACYWCLEGKHWPVMKMVPYKAPYYGPTLCHCSLTKCEETCDDPTVVDHKKLLSKRYGYDSNTRPQRQQRFPEQPETINIPIVKESIPAPEKAHANTTLQHALSTALTNLESMQDHCSSRGLPTVDTTAKLEKSDDVTVSTEHVSSGKELRKIYNQTCAEDKDAYSVTGSEYYGELYCHDTESYEKRYCCRRVYHPLEGPSYLHAAARPHLPERNIISASTTEFENTDEQKIDSPEKRRKV